MQENNQKKFLSLREQYPTFIYHEPIIERLGSSIILNFNYSIPNLSEFSSKFEVNFIESAIEETFQRQLLDLVFSIGMIDMLSYWKATCSPQIIIEKGSLNSGQKAWWKNLYWNGLSEFRYRNNIEIDESAFVDFSIKEIQKFDFIDIGSAKGNLIPVGGGKDSALTLEILTSAKEDNICFLLNEPASAIDVIETSGLKNIIKATRIIDPALLRLNKEGFLNGHTPFSALLAFLSIFVATVLERRYVVLSNESSADEGNIVGSEVNHQYSKTFAFEKLFNDYIHNYLLKGVDYFSLLRPFGELQIAKHFSKNSKYLSKFSSCNKMRSAGWCGDCSKCLFVYIMLSSFVPAKELKAIFQKNLLEDEGLKETFLSLIDEKKIKPFECVGTRREILAVCDYLVFQADGKGEPLPILLTEYCNQGFYSGDEKTFNQILSGKGTSHHVPEHFQEILRSYGLSL